MEDLIDLGSIWDSDVPLNMWSNGFAILLGVKCADTQRNIKATAVVSPSLLRRLHALVRWRFRARQLLCRPVETDQVLHAQMEVWDE